MRNVTMTPIGVVRSSRREPIDDRWDQEESSVILDPGRFSPDALAGLGEFSHAEIVYYMDQMNPLEVETRTRHPRGNTDWPAVGIFAQRASGRPNLIGVCVCRIVRIEAGSVYLEGLDAVDGTPVLDIKPWVVEFGPRGAVRQPAWISELMRNYWR